MEAAQCYLCTKAIWLITLIKPTRQFEPINHTITLSVVFWQSIIVTFQFSQPICSPYGVYCFLFHLISLQNNRTDYNNFKKNKRNKQDINQISRFTSQGQEPDRRFVEKVVKRRNQHSGLHRWSELRVRPGRTFQRRRHHDAKIKFHACH